MRPRLLSALTLPWNNQRLAYSASRNCSVWHCPGLQTRPSRHLNISTSRSLYLSLLRREILFLSCTQLKFYRCICLYALNFAIISTLLKMHVGFWPLRMPTIRHSVMKATRVFSLLKFVHHNCQEEEASFFTLFMRITTVCALLLYY